MALTVGDLVPNITMPGPDGERVELGARVLAGYVQVLGFADAATAPAMAAALVACRPGFSASRTIVAMAAPPDAWSGIDREARPIAVAERDFQLARALGAAPPCLWVLDPCRRLAEVIPWGEGAAESALAAARRIEARTPEAPIGLHAPVLVIPQVFEPEFCRQLIAYWDAGEKVSDMVATADMRGGGQAAEAQLKRRDDTPITDVGLTRAIGERLARRVGPMVAKAFRTTATHFETFRIGCYEAADRGHFGRHWDDTAPKTAHRKLAMSANLNTGEFEGGELVFPEFGRQRYVPPVGGAVIFSCALLHEALPVTAGRRFGLFGFFYDDAGAAHLREQIEAAGGRIVTEAG